MSQRKHRVCVLLELATDDPRLDPDRLDVSTLAEARAVRSAVIAALPKRVDRVIAVLPVELARLMFQAHEEAAKAAGFGDTIHRPPQEH